MQLKNTYGLVICGGQSSRMGTDKSRLSYHGTEQRYHVYHLLQHFCEKTFIACNEQQAISVNKDYDLITDAKRYAAIGPAAALLTASDQLPGKNFLVAGCDYPFLTREELQLFVADLKEKTAAFYNEMASVYEPLLAWYTIDATDILREMFLQGKSSLQQLLKTVHAEKYFPSDAAAIKSIDTPGDYKTALKMLHQN
ncbi:NTP transferase domain-containing protein [Chitinophagaceae bacterium MMS25-I14]